MLWLNFAGDLNVRVPEDQSEYKTDRNSVRQHDRLSISDTSNTIRWFVMRDELKIRGQIQDPEWSTNPDYIACLGDELNDENWDSYAVRISDKASLKLSENNMVEISTPHLWIGSTTTPPKPIDNPVYSSSRGGFADVATIRNFFGTDSVKVVYAAKKTGLTLFFIDYSAEVIKPVQLLKPKNRSTADLESPLISPDGSWIVYNCIYQGNYECYIQRLTENSTPILIAENAVDPHWWYNSTFQKTYIVYARLIEDYFTKDDYTKPELSDGTIGATYGQEILITSESLPIHASFKLVNDPYLIAHLPFKGGISNDGRFMCTGYGDGYIIRLN